MPARHTVNRALLMAAFGVTTATFGMKSVRMDVKDVQTTVISDLHPSCAVVVIEIEYFVKGNPNMLHEVLTAIKEFTHIPKEMGAFKKRNPDDELPPLLIGVGF